MNKKSKSKYSNAEATLTEITHDVLLVIDETEPSFRTKVNNDDFDWRREKRAVEGVLRSKKVFALFMEAIHVNLFIAIKTLCLIIEKLFKVIRNEDVEVEIFIHTKTKQE